MSLSSHCKGQKDPVSLLLSGIVNINTSIHVYVLGNAVFLE